MKLNNEQEKIVLSVMEGDDFSKNGPAHSAARRAAECCLDVPREWVMLTDEECINVYNTYPSSQRPFQDVIKAFIAKQSVPVRIPFDFEKWNAGGWLAYAENGHPIDSIYPGCNYTMEKIK